MKTQITPENIVDLIRGVLDTRERVGLHEPYFEGNESAYVLDAVETGWVSTAGTYVTRLEADLAAYTGVARAVATCSGTAALHVALLLAGARANSEVLLPAMTFVATANAVRYCGATPHFVDVSAETLGMDPQALRRYLVSIADLEDDACINRQTGRPIRAVLPMHTYGHPVDMDALLAVAREFRLTVIEDAAESLGSFYRERHTGGLGRMGILSFNGNKIVTAGGGGAILTNDEDLADRAKHLTTTAKKTHPWLFEHDRVGYNYRMPNLNAALAVAQLERLPSFLTNKRRLAERYFDGFANVAGATVFKEPTFARSNYWLNVLLLDVETASLRDGILDRTNAAGVGTRPVWRLMHTLPMFSSCPRMDLETSASLEARAICLPSSAFL